jgi:hypothetical protein
MSTNNMNNKENEHGEKKTTVSYRVGWAPSSPPVRRLKMKIQMSMMI